VCSFMMIYFRLNVLFLKTMFYTCAILLFSFSSSLGLNTYEGGSSNKVDTSLKMHQSDFVMFYDKAKDTTIRLSTGRPSPGSKGSVKKNKMPKAQPTFVSPPVNNINQSTLVPSKSSTNKIMSSPTTTLPVQTVVAPQSPPSTLSGVTNLPSIQTTGSILGSLDKRKGKGKLDKSKKRYMKLFTGTRKGKGSRVWEGMFFEVTTHFDC
jgi:hypothetical protein